MTRTAEQTGPNFQHLRAMTDEHGLFEHARHSQPRREHGYCVDDVARALVVTCRAPDPSASLHTLIDGYLEFTLAAIDPDGSSHNRMSATGVWSDRADRGDWWGRAVWGLGVASVHAPTSAQRDRATAGFQRAAAGRSPHLRSMAFAALGAGERLLHRPIDETAASLLRATVAAVGAPGEDAAWPWPEPRLTYANGAIVEALLLAGAMLPDPSAAANGLRLLGFLLAAESRDRHISVTPVGGRGPGDIGAGFDQQPIEVAALADACARAFDLTGNARWAAGVQLCWQWFLGDNDSRTPMVDQSTGGGYDGLEADGHNLNQGAESTLAALSTQQQALRVPTPR